MNVNRHKIIALLGVVVLLITTYLYLFKFYETLFWVYNLDPQLIDNDNNSSFKAYQKIIPAKKPYYFIQLGQVIILFIYCYYLIKSNSTSNAIQYNVARPQITHGYYTKPISSVMLYIAGAFLLLYIIIGLLGSIVPYGILG